jgi:purine-binding chemotaxis protein CheW
MSSDLDRYLAFSLGAEEYAIPLLKVREVIAVPEVMPTPYAPSHFLGIFNLRGQVISLVDLRLKLGIKPKEHSETTVIILDLGDSALALVVDSVNSVINPGAEDLSDPPSMESTKQVGFVTRVYRKEGQLILILDIEKTLNKDERNLITKAKAA